MAYISRDPFARSELHRTRVYSSGSCRWCGQTRRTPSGRAYLYQYRNESDGGRVSDVPGLFCCLSCMRIYHHQ